MTFGGNGFFGYSMCSPLPNKLPVSPATNPTPFIQWWSTYEVATPPNRKEQIAPEDIKAQLLSRHADWKSPYDSEAGGFFEQIIDLECRSESFTFDPRFWASRKYLARIRYQSCRPSSYVMPRLPFWSNETSPASETPPSGRGRVVLIRCCAQYASRCGTRGILCIRRFDSLFSVLEPFSIDFEYTIVGYTPLEQAAKAYEELREPRVQQILDITERNGNSKRDMGWFTEMIRDFFHVDRM